MMRQSIFLGRCLLSTALNGIGTQFKEGANNRVSITDMIPYPDIVLNSDFKLDVGGKKKSRL